MTSENEIDRSVVELVAAVSSANKDTIRAARSNILKRNPFLYTAFSDTLGAAERNASNKRSTMEYSGVIRARAEALSNWRLDDNATIAGIQRGLIDADSIKPHIRLPAAAYEQFYANQSEKIGQKSDAARNPFADSDCRPLQMGVNINHAFRLTHAVTMVETVLGLCVRLPRETDLVRWMDIGCGSGEIANSVNPRRHGVAKWEIIGCDLQEGKIDFADRRKAIGRSFVASDAFSLLKEYQDKGEAFDLVTMFEFLEHLEDPLRLITQLNAFRPKFVLAGSPLEQKFNSGRDTSPDPVHLWSFGRRAWEQMFASAGFEVVYSAEARVGNYLGGLDWLSVLCGPRDYLRQHRQSLRSATD